MYDEEIVLDLLGKMAELTERIRARFKEVVSVSELTDSSAGVEKLDLLLMPLIVIGELVTKIDHITKQALFEKYPQIPWREIKRPTACPCCARALDSGRLRPIPCL
jgi:uncharacterized protein with HEPN domain